MIKFFKGLFSPKYSKRYWQVVRRLDGLKASEVKGSLDYCARDIKFDYVYDKIRYKDVEIGLTNREVMSIKEMLEHPERVISEKKKEDILSELDGPTIPDTKIGRKLHKNNIEKIEDKKIYLKK
jgi:DNA-binding response OmpR family regulator